jgi:hypothetical protein
MTSAYVFRLKMPTRKRDVVGCPRLASDTWSVAVMMMLSIRELVGTATDV